jgi:hypothetical protein
LLLSFEGIYFKIIFSKNTIKMTDDDLDKKVADHLQEWKAQRKSRGILHHIHLSITGRNDF